MNLFVLRFWTILDIRIYLGQNWKNINSRKRIQQAWPKTQEHYLKAKEGTYSWWSHTFYGRWDWQFHWAKGHGETKDSTVFTIAHRLATISDYDKALALHKKARRSSMMLLISYLWRISMIIARQIRWYTSGKW